MTFSSNENEFAAIDFDFTSLNVQDIIATGVEWPISGDLQDSAIRVYYGPAGMHSSHIWRVWDHVHVSSNQ